ncbi:hypothetical protein LTR10_019024 [Elasticomyces elasticus]|uniref:USP domain-containing protein n=1 Tax=Exophiala sideris TaxID=1016849 RepID=A0ABR0J311_9EURO|nr:hypothetical protein LTR10_019024 [Elasticomyces elasticus]KAK5026610.1 hypothetical protein LTS07_007544 [Exophiala sideris]KAK5033650.1 hypothetical protein LTR13_006702 [Exophiala sideris]KAK5055473.1 hypothetical protein LTR69_008306 [Exophiala sideris]KAK5176441.1 hypothetical protein LTR44_011002 [Eurotiomycetes sp. CCFEE 6388]
MSSSLSDSSTRNRSDSNEGSELPEHEHKRPRLSETKPDGTQVMSDLQQTDSLPAPSVAALDTNHDNVERSTLQTPPLPPRFLNSAAVMSPTSKVTINTRPLSSQSVTQPTTEAGQSDMSSNVAAAHGLSVSVDGAQDSNPRPSTEPEPAEIPETISISSSPSKSPEIEIAEVEDYDHDPSKTRWTGRVGGFARPSHVKPIPSHYVHRTFPYAQELVAGDSRRALAHIGDKFQHTGAQDGDNFRQVKNWMMDFVTICHEFPSRLVEEDREFWLRLPDLVEALLRRDSGPPAQARMEDLIDFFVTYAQIAKMLMDYDVRNLQILSSETDTRSLKNLTFMSLPYLQPLLWLLQPGGIPFYDALGQTTNFEVSRFLSMVIDRLGNRRTVALLPSMSALSYEISPFLSRKSESFKLLSQLMQITSSVIAPLGPPADGEGLFHNTAFTQLDAIREDAADIILKVDNAVQQAIVKQAPWLNLDTAGKVIESLGRLVAKIAVEIPKIGQDIIASAGVGFLDADLTDLPSTMPQAWKFKTLRKFITNGRMELRVYGVDAMSTDLVQVYREHIETRPPPHTADPLVRFLVKFIRENQLIRYLVGVDSHPQIIRRSHNVVGFLCVSGTYTEADTDDIWQTILSSQDPRTVHEVFNLLSNVNVYDLDARHYICRKLSEYPFARFDPHVLQFTVNLLDAIRTQIGVSFRQATDPITRQLCIRLLREASRKENVSFEQAALIRRDLPRQFSHVLSLGLAEPSSITIDDEELSQIISDAAESLRSHSENATGDLLVLRCVLQVLDREKVPELVEKFNLTSLLVADFTQLHDEFDLAVQKNHSLSYFEVAYDVRSWILNFFIVVLPGTFSDELVELLWISYFTFRQLPPSIRAGAWDSLTHALKLKHTKDGNFVLDLIIDKYLQRLGSQDYNERLLEFLKTSVAYTIARSPDTPADSDNVVVLPGIDRIWRVMLEAPPNTVENQATDFIIGQYLDHQLITSRTKAVVDATHSYLVDRCVQQVIASASKLKSYSDGTMSGEDEPMVIIASDQEIRAEELRFDRSLLFLRKFLEGMKARPRYSPTPAQQAQAWPDLADKKGDSMELSLQVFNSKYVTSEVQKVSVGAGNTGNELWRYISDASGFTQFTVYHLGREAELAGQTATLAELKISSGLLMIRKTADSPENVPLNAASAATPVDNKIMHHFDELYDLLDADERLSREVYGFLSLFPAQPELVRVVRSMQRSPMDLLAPDKPFKLLYCARALRSSIEDESFSASPDTQFLVYGIRTIVTILPSLDLENPNDPLQMSIACGLIEALLLGFRAKVPSETSRVYIEDHKEFAAQMLRLVLFTLGSNNSNMNEVSASAMIKLILEAFIEACLHDDRVWDHVDQNKNFTETVVLAFIIDARMEARRSLLEVVVGLTGAIGTKLHLKVNNPRAPRSRFSAESVEACLSHLWTALVKVLPHACRLSEQCSEICETLLAIMRRIGKSFSIESLRQYLEQWSTILLRHEHVEVVGQPPKDHVVACLTKLLLECTRWLRNNNALPPSYRVIDHIISRFLFPPLSQSGEVTEETLALPVLDGTVRESLYNLVLALSQGPQDMATIVTKLNDDLLPRDFFEPMYTHERQSLRSEVGYAGLRNLSNTCYLNSLFTHLFMNVEFRAFFFDPSNLDDTKQKLVMELAKVFAHMQNSYEKSIDPSLAVEAITTYEGDQIDVSVQMDVDEFFNLLFDRLEGQIPSRVRNSFRSIYGGQLVQQVKSKECEHISERLEPFSAVQVEIKGKPRLEDSLRAYVEGEVLQGENKYSCTSCGRHVDAVKRACLKEVPNNIIFNLKRFDYDIMTGMRAKINDEFQFPDTLDMAPYTLARLSDEAESGEPDYFQLTGVIVHSGTADSGHYYSFIRQRPSMKSVQDSWVQFNDQDVTIFDPSQMRDNCFGGSSDAGFYQLPKFYSAYMLFYQRSSSIQKIEEQYRQHDAVNPIRLPLPFRMEQYIAQQNELFLRSYCAQDSSHAQFIRQLLERLTHGSETCSEDHILESSTIEMVLEYARQISSRWKELPAVEDTVKILAQYSEKCVECAKVIANWFAITRVLEDVLVRSPYQVVRKSFAYLFSVVFTQLHAVKSAMKAEDDDYLQLMNDYSRCLRDAVLQLAKLWDTVTKSGRCWTEYFGVLNNIQLLGDDEVILLLDEEYLEKCIDIVMIHLNNADFPPTRRLKIRYAAYLNAREKNRPFNHGILMQFLVCLILRVDLHQIPDGDYRLSDKKIGLTLSDYDVLGLSKIPANFEWIRRMIAGRHNESAVVELVTYLANDRILAGPLGEILLKGLNDRMINIATSFLGPALVFCGNCRSENQIIDLVQAALDSIQTVGVEYGREYFEFVDAVLKLENPFIDAEAGFLQDHVLSTLPRWAPTFILAPVDAQTNIRPATVDLMRKLLFNPLQRSESKDPQLHRQLRAIVQELATDAQEYARSNFLRRGNTRFQPGQVNQFIDVVEACVEFFDTDDTVEAEKVRTIRNTMSALRTKAEAAVETLSPDWQENSSDLAELSTEDYDEVSP